jgi:hypothetical protein
MEARTISLVAGGALLWTAMSASAQTPVSRPERPYRGVYASGTDNAQQVLTINGSVATGYDTDVLLGASQDGLTPVAVPYASGEGRYNQFGGGLTYTSDLDRLSVGASLSSVLRQYPDLDTSLLTYYAGSGGLSYTFGKNRGTTINGGGTVTYQSLGAFLPFASLGDPILGQVPAPGQDFGGARTKYFRYSSNAGITQRLSRRATLSASYTRDLSDFTNGAQGLDYQRVEARFTRSLSRYLRLRVGYGLTTANYDYLVNGRDYQYHNIDTGVDYSRDLSLTRRTKLAFSTGAAAIREGETTRYDVIGSATLNREIGRTWNAVAAYSRNAGFIETIGVPTFYDSINTSITGLISNRLSFHASAGASRGNAGYTTTAVARDGFDAVTGFAGLERALTRNLAVGLNYTYYRYNFEDAAVFVTPLRPRVNRHSVNVTLNAWAPIFKHGRKPNATR